MIKAVIFDCFGVLVREGWFALIDKYFADDKDRRDQAGVLMREVSSGLISHDDFIEGLAELADTTPQEVSHTLDDNAPDDKLFNYIEHVLKPHMNLGMLSNAGGDFTKRLFGAERATLFDEIVLSYQMGTVKPDPVMYETIAARLGVLPEECIFVDDQQRHCDGALKIGMKAVRHQHTDKTIERIEELIHAGAA